MFGRTGYGYRQPGIVDTFLAAEAEEEVFEDIARGDVFAAMEDMQAANDFSRGDTFGGMMDEMVADIF